MIRLISRALAALLFVTLASTGALAQWQVGAHNIPVGKGAGVVGFGQATAGAVGTVLLGKGTTTDPAFTALGGDVSSVNSSGSVSLDPEIHCLAALTSAADKIAYYSGSGTCALTDLSSGERTFLTTPSSANLRSVLTDEVGTGAAYFVGGALGTPASGTATNLTGLPLTTGVTGTLPVGNGGTGITSLGTGVATWWGTPSSANLAAAVTDETGSGALVFGTAPTITLGNGTGLPISTGVSGLGSGVATFLATPSSTNLASAITDETGSGAAVFANGPTLSGTVNVSQGVSLSGDISPSQITAAQNDYAPSGFSTATTLRLNSDASRNITGLAGGSGGLVKIIHNVGSNPIVLTNQDAASTAANRFLFGGDVTLAADTSITVKYDATSSRWRAITSPGSGGGGGGGVTGVTIATGSALTTSGTCTITTSGTCTVGLASLTSNSVLLGNGTSSPQTVAPGTSGNVLTSNGTTWQSTTPAGLTSGTSVASTSGTSIDFTGLPSGIKRVSLLLNGVSLSGTSTLVVQIGDSGGVETSGYLGSVGTSNGSSVATANTTTYAGLNAAGSSASMLYHGTVTISLVDSGSAMWEITGTLGVSGAANSDWLSFSKTLSPGPLDRVRLTTVNGTDTFDAGTVNILYER